MSTCVIHVNHPARCIAVTRTVLFISFMVWFVLYSNEAAESECVSCSVVYDSLGPHGL